MSARRSLIVVLIMLGVGVTHASATTIPIGIGAFGAGSTLTTFTGLAFGTEVNGLTVDGIVFSYSLGNGTVMIDAGPGVTNNIDPPNIVSGLGNNSGILTLMFPSLIGSFGYGFAILSGGAVPNATTISLFNGAIPIGSLSFPGAPDPTFTGGFAGIQSSSLFNRAGVTFNSVVAPAFALDNVRTSTETAAAVPEPATLLLLGVGLVVTARYRRRRRQR